MAKHDVTFTIPARRLGKAGLAFRVKRDGTLLGTLKVSKGAVIWSPKNVHGGFKLTWLELDKLMQASGQLVRRSRTRSATARTAEASPDAASSDDTIQLTDVAAPSSTPDIRKAGADAHPDADA